MIGLIKGTVEYRDSSHLIVDVSGVGYKILVPSSVLAKANLGEIIKLHTHTHVREDLLELYGFTEPEDLRVFANLISVSGIGCKTALSIFSVGSRSDIVNAIIGNDLSFFTSVPRLGRKNAQKIIIELKNKIGGEELDLSKGSDSDEVVVALKTFGFSVKEAQEALRSLKGDGKTTSEKIRLALRYLGK